MDAPLIVRIDTRLTQVIRGLPKSIRPTMVGLTFLGEPFMVLAIGFLGYVISLQGGRGVVTRAFLWAGLAFGLNTLLKMLLHRRRPGNLHITTLGLNSYSFPSGHAFGTVIFYGLFSYLSLHYLAQPLASVIAATLWALILSIGVSRIYLAAHYPTDVLGGWLLGGISLLAIIPLNF